MAVKCPKCHSENPETKQFCADCGTRLTPSQKAEISVTRTLETAADELARGTVFAGRYEIIEELGAGGMGRVYRAHDTKLNEEVALKLIKPEIAADRRVVERFRNEIKIARKIRHKNVCGMYDFHEEGRTLFLTMEYVRGEDLKSLIHRTKALTVGSAVSYAHQIAEGLGEAHKLGITHRDLKPGNIMIDKDGQAKIMDFGIARVKQDKGVTGEGVVVGTPEYMSPEQVEGKPADSRSDIYSLGVILFEMVVGCPPFEGETPFSIATKHKTEPPPVPKKIIPQISEGLNRLILRCLEKDKAKRYQTADELMANLAAVEQTLPLAEQALTRAKTKTRTSREITVKLTPRKLIIPAAAALVLITAIVIALSVFESRPGKIDSVAVLPFTDMSPEKTSENFAERIHDALINVLSKISSLTVAGRNNVLPYKGTKKSISEIARDLKVAGIVTGSVVQTGNQVRLTARLVDGRTEKLIWGPQSFDRNFSEILSLYDEAALTIARGIHAQLTAQDMKNLARNLKVNPKAYDLYLQANSWLEPGPVLLDLGVASETCLGLYKKSVEIDPKFASGYAALALFYATLGKEGYWPAKDAFPKAKEAAIKALSLDDSVGDAHAALGSVKATYEWDFPGAEKEFQRARELGQSPTWPSYGATISYLVQIQRFADAIALAKRLIDLNPLYPNYPLLMFVYLYARHYDEAIETAKKCIELKLTVQFARSVLMDLYALKGLCPDATAEAKKFVNDYPIAATEPYWLYVVGYVYAACGDRKEAQKVIELIKKSLYSDPAYLAMVYGSLGEKDLAFAALEKAYEQRSPTMIYLNVEPMLDSLRNDPRFTALLKKVGFAQ